MNTYYYAGTPIGITEYNWGAEGHINGATTQADIYGIFGREGLDFAARWTTPDTATPTYKAMKMYRNYDGNRSTFGDTSVRRVFDRQRRQSVGLRRPAVERSGAHGDGDLEGAVRIDARDRQHRELLGRRRPRRSGSSPHQTPSHISLMLPVSAQSFTATVPAQSVTLFVVAASSAPPNQPPVARATATPSSGTAPLAVAFDGSTSSDADGSIASYAWTFGDGGNATGPTANHTYTAAGSYSAKLTVTDNQGATGTTTIAITVNPGATRSGCTVEPERVGGIQPARHAQLDR